MEDAEVLTGLTDEVVFNKVSSVAFNRSFSPEEGGISFLRNFG
jgi:hypothetical protein